MEAAEAQSIVLATVEDLGARTREQRVGAEEF
jgi:hypothetical protein